MTTDRSLVIDIGNSKIKSAIFHHEDLVGKYLSHDLYDVSTHFADLYDQVIVCSVGDDEDLAHDIFPHSLLYLKSTTPLPIALDYHTPLTLGKDRIAAAVGARFRYPGDLLVIDAGSCITYDLVDNQGVYRGGVISPGLVMRMRAMSTFTRKLPDISEEWPEIPLSILGKSTKECMVSGAYMGLQMEIEGYIFRFKEEYPHLNVILTGGDTHYFESKLKDHIFADFDLVLYGLNKILNYNK